MTARIIGIGREFGGDDAAGLAVIRKLRELNAACDLVELEEPARLIELLTDGADPVVMVDAVVDGGAPGRVVVIDSGRPDRHARHLLSTHGLGVIEAIDLARIARPESIAGRIAIVGITIAETARQGIVISPAVQTAIPVAAAQALKLARRE